MTGLEGVTPEIAASGLEEALKVLRARRKRIIVFCLFRGWNLMENASSAFLSAVRKSMRPIRAAIGATTVNPELLTSAERLQYEGYLRTPRKLRTLSPTRRPPKRIASPSRRLRGGWPHVKGRAWPRNPRLLP